VSTYDSSGFFLKFLFCHAAAIINIPALMREAPPHPRLHARRAADRPRRQDA
jgi:hypothetical protein